MTMIIVSSLDQSVAAYEKYAPAYVISILEADEASPPLFDAIAPQHHLRLIQDCSRTEAGGADKCRCTKLIDLAERWRSDPEPRSPILIHCHRGVARSMAVAYILMCAIENHSCEKSIAKRLREAAPHADPNLMLVSEADALLHRDDRMVEAIMDLCPNCGTVEKPVITLPVMA